MVEENRESLKVHPHFEFSHFKAQEQQILKKMATQWFLTYSGKPFSLLKNEYRYFLMKPSQSLSEMFNLERELLVVFSDNPYFISRDLDPFDFARKKLTELRVETVCCVLISGDKFIESKIEALLKSDPEQPIVIPFSYAELLNPYNDFFFRNRFRRHFYSRDLFDFRSPLKKDLYFFARNELIQDIVNRHRSGEHTGLFGLRKSGKTSIIYAIERHLSTQGERFLSIDCESPSIHKLRWNELLLRIVRNLASECKCPLPEPQGYDEKSAADSFSIDMLKIYKSINKAPILILFDEIERISPKTGASSHWQQGDDFVYFWQALRAFFQRNPRTLTYMIVGTNPNCIEESLIMDHENPIFASIPSEFVPSFTLEQVKHMVSKLGRYMGLQFDDLIFSKLTEDFGGHPFLIRQMCSYLHRACTGPRPAKIDRPLYDKTKKQFYQGAVEYFDMILDVLKKWYPDEYDMLCILAQQDMDSFMQFARNHALYTKHLVGYGVIQESPNGYSFSVEAIRDYLVRQHKYERVNPTEEEKLQEISARRNSMEKSLRVSIRNVLLVGYGKKKAAETVLSAIEEKRREKLKTYSLDALLSKDGSDLFLLDLIQILNREWALFQNVFEIEKDKLIGVLKDINDFGRPDAHAKKIKKDDFIQLRLHFNKLEEMLALLAK